MRWIVLSALVATTALAGPRGRGNVNVQFGTAWLGGASNHPAPRVVYQPVYVPLAWWTWYPVQPQVQPAPPPPPEPIIIEREIIREVRAPQVIVVEQAPAPAPAVAPAPPPVAPAPAVEVAKPQPPAPRVPGPDVFTWIDDDGVTHFSTRVPSEAKARARKVGASK
jgi:hypothetical protein